VNIVNAPLLLRERGIELVEQRKSDVGEFSSRIAAEVLSEAGTTDAAGTLFGNNMPRLVQQGGFRLESSLEGILMFFVHRDMPGVIGKIGTVFGRHRINIAHMSVGRGTSTPGGYQVGVLGLDNQPTAEALADVLALDAVKRAWVVSLPPADELPHWMGR
jgi:D-3-phosphoglycerate dehydrogenase